MNAEMRTAATTTEVPGGSLRAAAVVGAAVCIHCGHPMQVHGRRPHDAAIRYRCHNSGCRCEYDLLHAE